MLENDTLSRILYVDLTKRRIWNEDRPEIFEDTIGGAGAGIRLLQEECPEGADPLGPENPIILTVGPLTGLFPMASKTVAMFKSPHTGNLGESHSGGRSATSIRLSGYGAVVIRGVSESPVFISVHNNQAYIRDASALWGMHSSYTVGRIIRDYEPDPGIRTIIRIGIAGERMISYASVSMETYRHFGRLGLGAVFGSKKLKALVFAGKHSVPVSNRKQYLKVYDSIYQATLDKATKKYRELGTSENVLPLNELGSLPTRNLKQSRFESAHRISGEKFAEDYLGRRVACAHCPVGCIHLAALRQPYKDEPYFYKTSMIPYDYEPIYALGSMLGIPDIPDLLKLLEIVETYGLDCMSTGVILAWATEAYEKGLISERETDGVKLSWGDYRCYIRAVENIIDQPNDFYKALAKGVEYASDIYGGKEFALSYGGNEMPGYHTGPAAHIGFFTGARHSHLDNAGYSVDQKTLIKEKVSPQELARLLIKEEQWRQILSSLVVCYFARGIYTPEIVLDALRLSGFEMSQDELNQIGAKTLFEKNKFKFREGFKPEQMRIPRRILETVSPVGYLDEEYIKETIKYYMEAVMLEPEPAIPNPV
ncbi:TPA: aldehyde:ferredoxin oxidoreductase [Candidatus Poribacteria bacterium]|nr:aldehyde:ferredoxin oxidoreductase [Candidatus Poribacteria bacterium]